MDKHNVNHQLTSNNKGQNKDVSYFKRSSIIYSSEPLRSYTKNCCKMEIWESELPEGRFCTFKMMDGNPTFAYFYTTTKHLSVKDMLKQMDQLCVITLRPLKRNVRLITYATDEKLMGTKKYGSAIASTMSLSRFIKKYGKLRVIELLPEYHSSDNTAHSAYRQCVFTASDGSKVYVDFYDTTYHLTEKEILEQMDQLRVVTFKNGDHLLIYASDKKIKYLLPF